MSVKDRIDEMLDQINELNNDIHYIKMDMYKLLEDKEVPTVYISSTDHDRCKYESGYYYVFTEKDLTDCSIHCYSNGTYVKKEGINIPLDEFDPEILLIYAGEYYFPEEEEG